MDIRRGHGKHSHVFTGCCEDQKHVLKIESIFAIYAHKQSQSILIFVKVFILIVRRI